MREILLIRPGRTPKHLRKLMEPFAYGDLRYEPILLKFSGLVL